MAPLIALLLYLGPVWGWTAFILAAVGLSSFEFFNMSHPDDPIARGAECSSPWGLPLRSTGWATSRAPCSECSLLSRCFRSCWRSRASVTSTPPASRMAATTFGPLWLVLLMFLALLRRDQGSSGPGYVLMSLMFAWMADSGAYFAGRAFGKHKLYEAVSPKKTVEGLVGALLGAMLGATLAHFWYLPVIPLTDALALALIAGLLGQLGDLGESLLKRSTGVKDSGEIVPGHGGMLDRLDALFVTSALVYLYTRWC